MFTLTWQHFQFQFYFLNICWGSKITSVNRNTNSTVLSIYCVISCCGALWKACVCKKLCDINWIEASHFKTSKTALFCRSVLSGFYWLHCCRPTENVKTHHPCLHINFVCESAGGDDASLLGWTETGSCGWHRQWQNHISAKSNKDVQEDAQESLIMGWMAINHSLEKNLIILPVNSCCESTGRTGCNY